MYAIEAVQNASRRYMAGDLGGKLYHVLSGIVEVNFIVSDRTDGQFLSLPLRVPCSVLSCGAAVLMVLSGLVGRSVVIRAVGGDGKLASRMIISRFHSKNSKFFGGAMCRFLSILILAAATSAVSGNAQVSDQSQAIGERAAAALANAAQPVIVMLKHQPAVERKG